MTGPVAVRIRGPVRSGAVRQAARRDMSVEVVTFGCRLNAYESEVIRRNARAAGLADTVVVNTCAVTAEAVRQARQAIRKARARAARGAHRGHRLRGADRAADLRRHARGRSRARQRGEARAPRAWARRSTRSAAAREVVVNDIMAVTETALHLVDGLEGRTRALRAGAERLRPSLHLLHHPVSAAAIRARCRWARWWRRCAGWSSNGYREVVLTGVDITSYGADLPGAPKLGTLVKQILQARAGAASGCGSRRSTRSRPTPTCSMRSPTSRG